MTSGFDHHELARRLNCPLEKVRELESLVARMYGHDESLGELRIIRILHAVESGTVSLDDVLADLRTAPPARKTA